MGGIKSKPQKRTPSLPHDIIENILSRIPVKSLLRFKAVSKQWEATISDPKFAETHLQQSKNLSCRNLLAWDYELSCRTVGFGGFHLFKLEKDKLRKQSAIEYPREKNLDLRLLCYCDGLLLKRCGNLADKKYLLWNPSNGTYKEFCCPYPIDHITTLHGICYDRLVGDYKVVIADMKRYAVFYCRNNYWTGMKEMKEFSCGDDVVPCKGVSFNGSFYWVLTTRREEGGIGYELVCFDWRDEKFKKLAKPDCAEEAEMFGLTSLGGHLCLFLYIPCAFRTKITIMRKVGDDDSWMEVKVQLPISCPYVIPFCLTNENEIILNVGDERKFILYNWSKNTFAEIQKGPTRLFFHLVPYLENLVLL